MGASWVLPSVTSLTGRSVDQQSRQQVLRAYRSNIYILCKGRYQIPSQTLQEDHLRPVQASLQPRPRSLP